LIGILLIAGIAFVLYDWIYHYITDESPTDINALLRLFEPEERKRLMFMDGLTKSLGASNIRNAHLIASEAAIDFIASRASHNVIPDFYSQAVAMAAFVIGFAKAARTIIEPTNNSRRWLKD
jgi:aspartate/methionine/tyrosine aminotransferase